MNEEKNFSNLIDPTFERGEKATTEVIGKGKGHKKNSLSAVESKEAFFSFSTSFCSNSRSKADVWFTRDKERKVKILFTHSIYISYAEFCYEKSVLLPT